jgi:hypothetical protein
VRWPYLVGVLAEGERGVGAGDVGGQLVLGVGTTAVDCIDTELVAPTVGDDGEIPDAAAEYGVLQQVDVVEPSPLPAFLGGRPAWRCAAAAC